MESTNAISDFTRDKFREHLEKIYNCKWLGQPIARPYAEQDEVPDQFRCPKGNVFNVPQPSAKGGKYYQWVIDDVLIDNELEIINSVYVATSVKKDAAN